MSWAWPFGIFHSSFRPNTFLQKWFLESWVALLFITEVTDLEPCSTWRLPREALVEDLQRVLILLQAQDQAGPKIIEHCWAPCCYTFLWKKETRQNLPGREEMYRHTLLYCHFAGNFCIFFFFFFTFTNGRFVANLQ